MKKLITIEENHSYTECYEPSLQIFKTSFFLSTGLKVLSQQPVHSNTADIRISKTENPVSATVEALFYFFSNQYDRLSERHLGAVTQLSAMAQNSKIAFMSKPRKMYPEAFLASGLFAETTGNVKLLIAECRHKDFAVNLAESALAGQISLPSPFSAKRAYCQESYEVAPELNCLRFIDGSHSFFLMQFLSSADGVYFPVNNILLSFGHINESHAQRLQEKLLENFAKTIAYATSANIFYGIIASHNRPSHFYYDVWPVLFELLNKQSVIENKPTVIMRKNHDFNDLGLLFDYRNTQVLTSSEINRIAIEENRWFVHLGTQQHLVDRLCYEVADRYLVDTALQSPSAIALEKTAQIAASYPIVYIGIEGQKRCWLEQIEGYAYIINQLAGQYPDLGVIFDGWTMPFTPSDSSILEVEKDSQVVDKILKLVNRNINHVSVVGETSNTKLVVGKAADFFICNLSTGSLHISRLLAKPGFCHLSARFSYMALRHAMHIHPNQHVYLLPRKYINDKEDKTDIRHDFLSYSIDKTVFYHFIEERLSKVLNKPVDLPIRFFIEPSYSITYDLGVYLKMATHGNFIHMGENKIPGLAQYPETYLKRQLVYGPFPFGSDKKANIHADYLIWLRNPLSRICCHAVQLAIMSKSKGQSAVMGDIFKAGHKALDNYITRLLTGNLNIPFGKCTEKMLIDAINNLENRFIYIGINEKPVESYDLLCTTMNWDRTLFADGAPVRYEVNEKDFSDDERRWIKEMNHLDLHLYDAALEIFNLRHRQFNR